MSYIDALLWKASKKPSLHLLQGGTKGVQGCKRPRIESETANA
jgi:hypothetical protein